MTIFSARLRYKQPLWPVVMIRLLNPELMDQVMWLGGWNEVYVGRHTPVKNCMKHMTQYGQFKNSNHAYTDATCKQMFIIRVNYIQQIIKNFSLPR